MWSAAWMICQKLLWKNKKRLLDDYMRLARDRSPARVQSDWTESRCVMESKDQTRERIMAQRKEVISALEAERGTKVITLIHRREPWDDDARAGDTTHLTIEDSEFVLMQIRSTPPDRPIDFIVHTPGGLALAAEMIATALKLHPARVTVIVPFYAMSGGTLVALAADEICMEPYSVLGPVDPQIGGWPSGALMHLIQKKPPEMVSDQMWMLAEIARLSLASVQRFILWLLAEKLPQQLAAQTAEFLTGGYITHDTPIMLDTVRTLGLPVNAAVPGQVYELFETCAFGVCKRPCLATYNEAATAPAPGQENSFST
jgi:ClpP class serine protease